MQGGAEGVGHSIHNPAVHPSPALALTQAKTRPGFIDITFLSQLFVCYHTVKVP